MKKAMKSVMLVFALLITAAVMGQTTTSKKAAWTPEQGYWVVESASPQQHQIRFYNNEDVLLYSEKLDGVKLKPAKRKVQMQLKAALESAVYAWEQTKKPSADRAFVKRELK
jgi:stress-induced morphogen